MRVVLRYRREGADSWNETPMRPQVNDRWEGEFRVHEIGRYVYTIEAWADRFVTWQRDLRKRLAANQSVGVDLQIGASLVAAAADRASGERRDRLRAWAETLDRGEQAGAADAALGDELTELMAAHPDRRFSTTYGRQLTVVVERPRARYSSWYEFFPRSASPEAGRHGTLADCHPWLERIAAMGFDVVYLPPIHPIGRTHRKGPNNQPAATADDVGSPWAIGGDEGGHKSVHPQLGTLDDFRDLVAHAQQLGIEIALDVAFQCSPDHPYVREHREWFRRRPDGTIQYAENPPKKYEDIYPFDFETEDWRGLWEELKSVVLFWIEQGVRIFRVDNPHTKPLPFWHWLIEEVRRDWPETIFLSEAFTRPKVMKYLAKAGFSQSYTYFTWRNTKHEMLDYLRELTKTETCEYFRPSFWPNTPDILPEHLQFGGRAACMARLVLAATLSASYGVYGPPLEMCEVRPREPGSEEYLDSEKYQLRHWDLQRQSQLEHFMRRINGIRRQNPALQSNYRLRFHDVDNPEIIAYSKQSEDGQEIVLTIVNLDVYHAQSGWLDLPLEELDIDPSRPYQAHDLLGDSRFLWHGRRNFVQLNPQVSPAHIFRLRRQVRREHQFEYFM
jgi:starch synthase (maltosyl-transferring)